MKTRARFKFLLFFFLPLTIFAAKDGRTKKHTEEKTIKKEFKVNSNATLKVDNSYGNLNIITWEENRILIEVHISVNGHDKENVQRKLDAISVDFDASPSFVSAETIFNEDDSWWEKLFQSNSASMEINYLIKMPITNQVNLENDYGNITLDKLKGRAVISCDYGKITTNELLADNNSISFDYTDNSYFEYIKSGTIEADYSDFTVGKTKNLTISADYSDSTVEIAEEIQFGCDYGSLEIQKANTITGNGDYLTMRFGDIYKNLSLEASYGSIHVEQMMETAGDIHIDSGYTGIEIGINPGYAFQFSINLEYASLDAPDHIQFTKKINDSGDKYYEGFYGSSSSGNAMKIESDYGSVELFVR